LGFLFRLGPHPQSLHAGANGHVMAARLTGKNRLFAGPWNDRVILRPVYRGRKRPESLPLLPFVRTLSHKYSRTIAAEEAANHVPRFVAESQVNTAVLVEVGRRSE
jgi:hypothetical protein